MGTLKSNDVRKDRGLVQIVGYDHEDNTTLYAGEVTKNGAQKVAISTDNSTGDAFGRLRVSNTLTIFDGKQIFDNLPLFWDEQLTGSGITSSHSKYTASTTLTSTLNTAGKFTRQTFASFNYQPGKSQLILMTGVLDKSGGGTGVQRRIGLFNEDNGLFFEDDEGTVKVVRRSSLTGAAYDFIDDTVAQWKLNDNAANTTVVDSMETYNGTASTNTANLTADGKIGSAFNFVASNSESVDIGSTAPTSTGNYTILGWFKYSAEADFMRLYSEGNTGDVNQYQTVGHQQNGQFIFTARNGANIMSCTTTTDYGDGEWHSFMARREANNDWTLQMDGGAEEVTDTTTVNAPTRDAVRIGSLERTSNTNFWNGDIDNLLIMTRAITDAEYTAWHNAAREELVPGDRTDTKVAQTSWNIDKMDGTGPSALTVDWTKSQIFVIDFEWLGVGRVRFGLNINGTTHYIHELLNANNLATVYISSPNLPLRYELETTDSSPASTLECICSSVESEGGVTNLGILRHKDSGSIGTLSTGTLYAILGIRLKRSQLTASVLIETISVISTTVNDQLHWELIFNPTVAGTFTYSDQTDSNVQVATGGTGNTVTGGIEIDGGYLSTSLPVTNTVPNALRLGTTIDEVADEIVLCVKPITNNITVEASMTWRELS